MSRIFFVKCIVSKINMKTTAYLSLVKTYYFENVEYLPVDVKIELTIV